MLENALLWKVSSHNTEHISYIFGTIHLNTASFDVWINVLEEVVLNVNTVYTEAPLDQQIDQSAYYLSENKSISDIISERKYKKLVKILKKSFSFDLDRTKSMLPLLITQQLAMVVAGAQNKPSIDIGIYQMAKRNNKIYKGIESIEEQKHILTQIPEDHQIASLAKVARDVSKFRKSILRLVELYERQNISKLYKFSKKEMGEVKKLLLDNRNELFTERIAENHILGPCLFSFGSGHLAGNKGVLALLKRKGFKIKAVMPKT